MVHELAILGDCLEGVIAQVVGRCCLAGLGEAEQSDRLREVMKESEVSGLDGPEEGLVAVRLNHIILITMNL